MTNGGDDYKKSIEQITGIFSDIVKLADAQSKERCPYRNRHDHCTALFRCGHQNPVAGEEPPVLACDHEIGPGYAMKWTGDPLDGA